MLLRFSFENAFCFLGEATLSMVASSDRRHPHHVSKSARPGSPEVLRAAGIYGANGHGKTKLVDAALFVKRFACGEDEKLIARGLSPFKLKKGADRLPSRFVVNFRTKRADYEYGLIITDGEVEQEWLFETEKRQEVLLFSRERIHTKNVDEQYRFEFGSKLRRSKSPSSRFKMEEYLQFIGVGVKSNKSFLSEAFDKKIRRLNDCSSWFQETLQVVRADARYSSLHVDASQDKAFLDYLSESLSLSDTGIGELKIRETDAPEEVLAKIPLSVRERVLKRVKDLDDDHALVVGSPEGPRMVVRKTGEDLIFLEFVTVHSGEDGDVEFSLEDESSGTQRLLDLYPMLYNLAKADQVYIVDELDRKLHPLLAYNFVQRFLSAGKGQLIFTTHTTFLLDLDLLRRDEVWLVQKKANGSSELYSLNEFKIRPDLDIRKGYLQGRFGGVPFVGDPKSLGWC